MIDRCLGPIGIHVVADYQRKEPQNFLGQSGLVGYSLSHMVSEKLKNSWRGQNRGNQSEENEKGC